MYGPNTTNTWSAATGAALTRSTMRPMTNGFIYVWKPPKNSVENTSSANRPKCRRVTSQK